MFINMNIDIKMQEEEVSDVKYIPFEIYEKEILGNNKEFVNRGNEFKEIVTLENKDHK